MRSQKKLPTGEAFEQPSAPPSAGESESLDTILGSQGVPGAEGASFWSVHGRAEARFPVGLAATGVDRSRKAQESPLLRPELYIR